MSQPFTDEDRAFVQALTQDEVARGEFEFNLRYLGEASTFREGDGSYRFVTADGGSFAAEIGSGFPPRVQAEELRQYFLRNGLRGGDTVALEFGIPRGMGVRILTPGKFIEQSTVEGVEAVDRMHTNLNTILYGPPGTGKTYKTAEIAVRICDGRVGHLRHEVMKRYEELQKEGRISFVTFHQSYSYEEFVEGLRPEPRDNGQVAYPVRPGVFRESCDAARRSRLVQPGLTGKPLGKRTIYKMSLGEAGTNEGNRLFQECIENGYVLLGCGENVDFTDSPTAEDIRKKLAEEWPDASRPESHARYVALFKNELQVGDIVIVSYGNRAFRAIGEVTGEYQYLERSGGFNQMRPVRWLVVFEAKRDCAEIYDRNFVQSTLYKLDNQGLNFDALDGFIKGQSSAVDQPFVLIVDEINRANISKVFGELITLLEPDKREGAENALKVKLPYSGDEFGVPSNLFVVGTMNTADRSIALLDTALRRRFEFEELMPEPSQLSGREVDGIQLDTMLAALNERVEYLYDRDHTIGHAYFMNVRTLDDLEVVFRRKVIPLLQEYFYEDWSRVRQALNDHGGLFVEMTNGVPKGLEAIGNGFDPKPRYSVRREPFSPQAYLNIYR